MSNRFRRALFLHDIVARKKPAQVAFAAASDFDLRPVRCIGSLSELDNALIYCFDAVAERALFTLCDDLPGVLKAPFLYEAQFLQAKQMVSIPFEQLDGLFDAPAANPSFVFSIGRCGSTLLSALLGAAGVQSVSEPDILTQLAELPEAARACLSPGTTEVLVRTCVGSLQAHCGNDVVIKLRSQCSRISTDIVQVCPGAKIIFMLRGRHDWARSRYRAFGETPAFMAHLLAWSIARYHDLAMTGRDVKLIWYEDLQAAPLTALQTLGVDGNSVSAGKLACVLARDAHHGSHLSHCALPAATMPQEALAAFDRVWAELRPHELIARYGLERLE